MIRGYNVGKTFRFFKVNPYIKLWEYIKEIRELEKEGIIREICPSPSYWEFEVLDFEKIPTHIKAEIISSGMSEV